MLESVHLAQLCHRFVHQVLASYIKGARKVVDLLVPLQWLIHIVFDRADIPDDACLLPEHIFADYTWWGSCSHDGRWLSTTWRGTCHELFGARQLSEPVVLQRIAYDLDVAISHVKVVAPVRCRIRSKLYRVLIDPEYKVLLPELIVDFNDRVILEKHWGKSLPLLFVWLLTLLFYLIIVLTFGMRGWRLRSLMIWWPGQLIIEMTLCTPYVLRIFSLLKPIFMLFKFITLVVISNVH